MKTRLLKATTALFVFLTINALATVRYVNLNNPSPVSPYTNWAKAAVTIQAAVNVAADGDTILVTNGVYQTGGSIVYGSSSNRVSVTKAVTVKSVNGPALTVIKGNPVIGDNSVRCVYLTYNASLIGFTLTNGATRNDGDGGPEQSGGGVWCEDSSAVVSNCVIVASRANFLGGGAYQATLNNCVLTGNSARYGGGAFSSTLNNCALNGNSAAVSEDGGSGGGVGYSTLNNCTLTGNSADVSGGGADNSTLYNCIVYYNTAPSDTNCSGSSLTYCCTTPLPDGDGNIDSAPQLADFAHVSAGSPCRGAGSADYVTGLDIDGEAWASPPAIGCDEYYAGAITGSLSVAITADYTNVSKGFAANLTGLITGHANSNVWNFKDGILTSNQPYVSHNWGTAGDYAVVFTAYNESNPGGVSATQTVHVSEGIYYIAQGNTSPVAPFDSWAKAATNIQDAVDAAFIGGTILVSNGVYRTGGRNVSGVSNRVAVTRQQTMASVNGPAVTLIDGSGLARCVYLTNGILLTGFTLTNGNISGNGGGVYCESASATVSNCVLTGNSVGNQGGGAFQGTLNNCTLRGNLAYEGGGAGSNTILNNCTLSGNTTVNYTSVGPFGGGAYYCTLNNCTLSGNSAGAGGGAAKSTLNHCILSNNSVVINNLGQGGFGGGAASVSTLNNCLLTGNTAPRLGGGAEDSCTLNSCLLVSNSAPNGGGASYNCALYNCTLVNNSATGSGGGAYNNCMLINCIDYYNTAPSYPNYTTDNAFDHCCTTPLPAGSGNFTNSPLFVNQAAGNFRLLTNSPCVDTGDNDYVTTDTDLDGNPRVFGGTVDRGAYESQAMGPFYVWLQSYGLPTDGSADYIDTDGDGMNNWQEWVVGTNPTNNLSVLNMLWSSNGVSGVTVCWQSVNNRTYFLQRSSDLTADPAFETVATGIAGQADTTSYTDTNADVSGTYYYRVGVQ